MWTWAHFASSHGYVTSEPMELTMIVISIVQRECVACTDPYNKLSKKGVWLHYRRKLFQCFSSTST